MRNNIIVAISAALVVISGPPARQDDGRIEFRITEAQVVDSMRLFEAEYARGDTVARFALALRIPAPSEEMAIVKAALLARTGSDARALLGALARLHEGKVSRKAARRLPRIDITAAVLGQALSHGKGENIIAGEFTTAPSGEWLVLKLFLDTPDGATTDKIGEPAEIFVALDPVGGRGWFLVKDPEYWPELNRVFATIL